MCFDALAVPGTTLPPKHDDDGLASRRECLETLDAVPKGTFDVLIERYVTTRPAWPRRIGASNEDDLLDAMALAPTATLADGDHSPLPATPVDQPPRDGAGLPVQIVYNPSQDRKRPTTPSSSLVRT